MIAVTGASGKLGRWVIHHLAKVVPPAEIVAAVRDPGKAAEFAALGVQVRRADYTAADSWGPALKGVEKVLLISSNDLVHPREKQHAAVIRAAKDAKVGQLVYTSILGGEHSTLGLAKDHVATERLLKDAGVPHTLLRNGWYLENHTENLGGALATGTIHGCAGAGRFASAAREDYALAAVKVLTESGHVGEIFELAGDRAFTLGELARVVADRAKKPITYQDHSFEDFKKLLLSFHLPEAVAQMLADSDRGAARGDLATDSRDLTDLIGRPTKPLATAVAEAIQ